MQDKLEANKIKQGPTYQKLYLPDLQNCIPQNGSYTI